MAGKNRNKEKGKGFERDICKIMTKYFGGSWIRTWGSGNYVGGISQDTEGKYVKRFDCKAGRECHNSPYMQQVRSQERAKREQARARRKAELEAQMKSAQEELENL